MGREVVVAITKGKLDFGPGLSAVVLGSWKDEGGNIFFHGEFDGR